MRIEGTLFACFPPRPCRRLGLLDRIKPQPEKSVPSISAGSVGCAEQVPAGSQPSITPAPLQPAAHCLYPCSRRSLPFCSHRRPVSPPAGHGSSCSTPRTMHVCASCECVGVCCDAWVHTHRACKHVLRIGRTSRPAYKDCTQNVFTVLQSRSSGPHRSALLSAGCHVWRCIAEIFMTGHPVFSTVSCSDVMK